MNEQTDNETYNPQIRNRYIVYHPTIKPYYIKNIKLTHEFDKTQIVLGVWVGSGIKAKDLLNIGDCNGLKICFLDAMGNVNEDITYDHCWFVKSEVEMNFESDGVTTVYITYTVKKDVLLG